MHAHFYNTAEGLSRLQPPPCLTPQMSCPPPACGARRRLSAGGRQRAGTLGVQLPDSGELHLASLAASGSSAGGWGSAFCSGESPSAHGYQLGRACRALRQTPGCGPQSPEQAGERRASAGVVHAPSLSSRPSLSSKTRHRERHQRWRPERTPARRGARFHVQIQIQAEHVHRERAGGCLAREAGVLVPNHSVDLR